MPFLKFSIRMDKCLCVDLWLCEIKFCSTDLNLLYIKDSSLEYWSQLENYLAHLHNKRKVESEVKDKTSVNKSHNFEMFATARQEVCWFLIILLNLFVQVFHLRRFSLHKSVFAYTLYIKSSNTYDHLRNSFLIFPSSRHLRHLSKNIAEDISGNSNGSLSTKAKYLLPKELYVNLLLDEIRIKPSVSYKPVSKQGKLMKLHLHPHYTNE